MKKTVRNILILLAVLVVLGGATLLLLFWPQDAGEEEESSSSSSSSEAEIIHLFDREAGDVESLDVKNEEDEYTVALQNPGADDLSFTIKGYSGYDLDFSQVSANVVTLMNLTAAKDLGSRDDLEAFGLGSTAVAMTVNYRDGGSEKLLLGNTAAETSGRYVLKDDTVYIAAGVPSYYYGSKFGYFNTDIYTIADRTEVVENDDGTSTTNTAEDIMYSMTLSGAHFDPDEIVIERSSKYMSGYVIKQPVTAESGNTAFSELITTLKTLSAASVVDAGITDEKLEQYGLLEPDAKIDFELNNSKHTITVSAKDSEGNRYMTADQTDTVYKVANDTVSQWAETSVLGLRMSYIWITNIKDVEEVSLTAGGKTYAYHVTRTVNEEKSTGTNTDYDLTITDANGKDIPYDGSYQPFYQKLISLAVFSQDTVDTAGTPDIKIQYKYFDGGSDTVTLYEMEGQNRYAAALNGQFNGQVRGSEVKAMLETIPQ